MTADIVQIRDYQNKDEIEMRLIRAIADAIDVPSDAVFEAYMEAYPPPARTVAIISGDDDCA